MKSIRDWAKVGCLDMIARHLVRKLLRVIGKVTIREREYEWVFSCLQEIRKDGGSSKLRLLDLGSSSSLLPLRLAMLGYEVVAMDLRPYPFRHKNLEFIQSDILAPDFEAGISQVDIVTCVSTLEHLGIGYYEDNVAHDGDQLALDNILRVLKPRGSLLLTVPYAGRFSQNSFQRVYDRGTLDKLFGYGWELQAAQFYIPRGRRNWVPATREAASQVYPTCPESNNGCFWFVKS